MLPVLEADFLLVVAEDQAVFEEENPLKMDFVVSSSNSTVKKEGKKRSVLMSSFFNCWLPLIFVTSLRTKYSLTVNLAYTAQYITIMKIVSSFIIRLLAAVR